MVRSAESGVGIRTAYLDSSVGSTAPTSEEVELAGLSSTMMEPVWPPAAATVSSHGSNSEAPDEGLTLELADADAVSCIAISPDEPRQLAGGGTDGSIRLWDLENQIETLRWVGHQIEGEPIDVTSLAFSPDQSICWPPVGRISKPSFGGSPMRPHGKFFLIKLALLLGAILPGQGKFLRVPAAERLAFGAICWGTDRNPELGGGKLESKRESNPVAILTGHLTEVSDFTLGLMGAHLSPPAKMDS